MNEKNLRVLAVIPARAGSKGIPNKNIRLLNGRPMIYYAIANAKNSKYITDVIITTDSPEVKLIGKQMDVAVKERSEELCADDVTLDAVIYDAIPKGEEFDYIVTLQATSPTLQVETLDRAIEYMIERDLDTLISATNAPHLSWSEREGKKVPNYEKRLNRQYLPPYYIEAGAFLISKAAVVTAETRIGEKIDVFEVPESEAIDVDTFADLKNAEFVLGNQKVAIYVNGNNSRGAGHIYRALEIADEFYSKPDIYYDINQADLAIFGDTTHNLIPVNSIAELFDKLKNENYSVFINDILATSLDYMIGLKTIMPNTKIVNFEDDGEGATKADLVFNALYRDSSAANVYAGEDYYICPKMFLFYNPIEIRDEVRNVLITFGGADPENYTDRILKIIAAPEYAKYHFRVVLGRAKRNVEELRKYASENIEILHDVKNMPELMADSDIAVTSRGRTGYELAMFGVPAIAMAQNEREEHHEFVSEENGFSYIGKNPSDEIIKGNLDIYLGLSKASREELQEKLLAHDLKNGRKRVMNLINNL